MVDGLLIFERQPASLPNDELSLVSCTQHRWLQRMAGSRRPAHLRSSSGAREAKRSQLCVSAKRDTTLESQVSSGLKFPIKNDLLLLNIPDMSVPITGLQNE